MTDERCIICGETEDGTPSAESAHFQSPTHVHEFLPPSKIPVEAFLVELTRRAREYGHDGDYVAIVDFVRAQYHEAGITMPDLEPFPVDE